MQTKNHYIPGVCNIGKSEIRKRKQAGWIGFATAVILYSSFVYLDVQRIWRFVIFIPATMSAAGFLQAYMQFCAYFGMRGVFNFVPEIGREETVENAEFRATDRRKALQIIIYSLICGVIAAVFAYYIP